MTTQTHLLAVTHLRPASLAAIPMATLALWLLGGTASAESESSAPSQAHAEALATEARSITSTLLEREQYPSSPDDPLDETAGAQGRLAITDSLEGAPASLPPDTESRLTIGVSDQGRRPIVRSPALPSDPPEDLENNHQEEAAPQGVGGDGVAAAFSPGRIEPVVTGGPSPSPSVSAGEVGAQEPRAVARGRVSTDLPGPQPQVGKSRGDRLPGTGEESAWAPASGFSDGFTLWSSHGARLTSITTGTDRPTGDERRSTGALLAGATSSGSGTAHGFDSQAATRCLLASGLGGATAFMARFTRGRLRTKTVQGAVAGAGPPSAVFLLPLPAAIVAAGTLVARTRSLLRRFLTLASIRWPDPASRWRAPSLSLERWSPDHLGVLPGRS